MQTIYSNEKNKIRGNCLWAAISSVTEINLEKFKGFQDLRHGAWFSRFWDIMTDHNFMYKGMIREEQNVLDYSLGIYGYYVVCGGSPRGCPSGHAVVFKGGKMVHDPHPEGAGLTSVDYAYMIERV